ncbi:MAG TPA: carboxypeptidase-like regulatory domain-containing protein, partial [Terriglobales bacterium]|nr:carboxypeptidase-like regulatory domain-containing protein [Terriglobales bacterium]
MRFPKNSTVLMQWLAISMLTIVLPMTARAQVSTGTILGNVNDPSGAIVSGATIVITNVDTGEIHTATSNSSGIYAVPDLPAGRYRVEVSAPTFQTETVEGVLLDVGEKRTINPALKVGAASAKVIVTATSATVDLDSAVVMPVVNDKT